MHISLFDYQLPIELIAQYPVKRRDQSRLMILDRKSGSTKVKPFRSLVDYLQRGDALVINNTRVFKSRLIGQRSTGAEVEVFLVRISEHGKHSTRNTRVIWEALVRPSRRLKENEQVCFGGSHFVTLIMNKGEGKWLVGFESLRAMNTIVNKYGHVPLPQYINRLDEKNDIRRYQTIFARADVAKAVAAPTAGLHFTNSLLEKIKRKGVKVVKITLDVGPGTFKPVNVEEIENHVIDEEWAYLSPRAAWTINRVKASGGRVFAVGTTSVRTLESANIKNNQIQSYSKPVDLYIQPGFKFCTVDCLLTNFHLPKSSLLILVSAFAGREKVLAAYNEAINQNLRFYSYGDAMLII